MQEYYVLQSGKYKEVPRIKAWKIIEFNHRRYHANFLIYNICNFKSSLNKDQFITIEQDTINKKGFLVIQNQEWSEIKLFRVPNTGSLKDNEKGNEIITEIGNGCDIRGVTISIPELHNVMTPKEIDIKQAKQGENAYIYVPSTPVEKGYYLVDYKLNGKEHVGWNPIAVK